MKKVNGSAQAKLGKALPQRTQRYTGKFCDVNKAKP
jgi:hypothetical protein